MARSVFTPVCLKLPVAQSFCVLFTRIPAPYVVDFIVFVTVFRPILTEDITS